MIIKDTVMKLKILAKDTKNNSLKILGEAIKEKQSEFQKTKIKVVYNDNLKHLFFYTKNKGEFKYIRLIELANTVFQVWNYTDDGYLLAKSFHTIKTKAKLVEEIDKIIEEVKNG